jgi:hypothetical protein
VVVVVLLMRIGHVAIPGCLPHFAPGIAGNEP